MERTAEDAQHPVGAPVVALLQGVALEADGMTVRQS
jgi:hypothetical protein